MYTALQGREKDKSDVMWCTLELTLCVHLVQAEEEEEEEAVDDEDDDDDDGSDTIEVIDEPGKSITCH